MRRQTPIFFFERMADDDDVPVQQREEPPEPDDEEDMQPLPSRPAATTLKKDKLQEALGGLDTTMDGVSYAYTTVSLQVAEEECLSLSLLSLYTNIRSLPSLYVYVCVLRDVTYV